LDAIEAGTVVLEPKEEEEMISASAIPAYKGMVEKEGDESKGEDGKFSEAERRLREELAAFKLK
jgi:transcription termination/antitermination protein NusA